MNYIFVGGTYRGFKLMENLIHSGYKPDYMFILKEDDSETDCYSQSLQQIAENLNIGFIITKKITANNEKIIREKIRDFCIVCGWRTLINPSLTKYFKLGLLAAHDSLLPKYRGFAPLNWAIINGEKETGVTVFKINDGEVDSGDIYKQRAVKIKREEYAKDVLERVTLATIDLFQDFMNDYLNGAVKFYVQNESLATYTCKRIQEDGKINWNKTSLEIYNLIRAIASPYPGAFCIYNNKKYHIRKAFLGQNNSKTYIGNIPGRIIKIAESGIEVLCHTGTIFIEEWEDKELNLISSPSKVVRSITSTLD